MDSPDELSTPPQPRRADGDDDDDDRYDDADPDPIEEEEDEDEDEEDDQEEDAEDDDDDNAPSSSSQLIRACPTLEELNHLREIGNEAVCWSLSSAKPGNGVEQIRDTSNDTYWQSDGSQPHYIQISFARRVAISHICLYLDYNLDESYTPKRLGVKVGMTTQDLQSAVFPPEVDLHEPVGWCVVPLSPPRDPLQDDEQDDGSRMLRTHLVEICILSMHQNGRDTHIRQVKLFGPRRTGSGAAHAHQLKAACADVLPRGIPPFSTVGMSQFSEIR